MKEYLEKHNLRDIEDIAQHITELKRNTVPNLDLISSLCSYLFDGENKVRANFYRYENNDSPIIEVKHFKTLDDAQLYFIDSIFEEVFYYDESEFILGMDSKRVEKNEKQGVFKSCKIIFLKIKKLGDFITSIVLMTRNE